jgi:hypothetical protein
LVSATLVDEAGLAMYSDEAWVIAKTTFRQSEESAVLWSSVGKFNIMVYRRTWPKVDCE